MMKLIRDNFLIGLLVVAVIATGGALTVVSHDVYDAQKSLQSKNGELIETQWELRALKAEWAYLNRPDRLNELYEAKNSGKAGAISVAKAVPSTGEDMVHPVSFVPVPMAKPSVTLAVMTSSQAVAPTKTSAPVSEKSSGMNFGSLLKAIGGGE